MTSPLTIHIDIEDWHQETLREETVVSGDDDIIVMLEEGQKTGVIARAAVVSREKGLAPETILPANKLLLYAAARAEVSKKARGRKEQVKVRSGKTYPAPALVGAVHAGSDDEDDPDEPSYVPLVNPKALANAEDYLRTVLPGHIWHRLLTIYANGGDVEAAADALKEEINRQVREILYRR